MRYSLDASVALCWVVPRAQSGKALRLRADYQRAAHDLIAPSHFPAEVASALTKSERQGLIPAGQALPLLDDVPNDLPDLHPPSRNGHRRPVSSLDSYEAIEMRLAITM